jgi:hypothetical protein
MAYAGVPGVPRYHQTSRSEVKEPGEIDTVSSARAALKHAVAFLR